MSEIAQELGFDASRALAELQKLNTSLETTQNNLQKLGQAFRDFNSMSGQTTRAIATVANATANSLLNNVLGGGGSIMSRSGGGRRVAG